MQPVACPLCGRDDPETVYRSSQQCGPGLGEVPIALTMCQACGFLYQNPRPTDEVLGRYYRQDTATSGNTWYETEEGSRFDHFNRRRLEFFRAGWDQAGGIVPATILDIGCGAGHFLASLQEQGQGHRLTGLEPSEAASRRAQAKGLSVINAGIEQHPFADRWFDVVFCHSVLEHVRDLGQALGAITRLLRPAGRLFIELPDSTRPEPQVVEFFGLEHLSHFTPGTLHASLTRQGLRVVALGADDDAPRLRACATLDPEVVGVPAPADDRQVMRQALLRHADQRQILREGLAGRLDEMAATWRAEGRKVGIYGAGFHTRNLLAMSGLGRDLAAVIDSDPLKAGTRFLDWTVQSPDTIPGLGLDVIVISSRAFQDEIAAGLRPLQAQAPFEMVKLYE